MSVSRIEIGARISLGEACKRDGVDRTAALFSESTGRVLVSVGREDDVKFFGLCEARGIPVLRIGVTDNSGWPSFSVKLFVYLLNIRQALGLGGYSTSIGENFSDK